LYIILYYIIVLENTEGLIAASKEFGLGVNADKTKSCLEITIQDEVTI